jgi:hypothetical protein
MKQTKGANTSVTLSARNSLTERFAVEKLTLPTCYWRGILETVSEGFHPLRTEVEFDSLEDDWQAVNDWRKVCSPLETKIISHVRRSLTDDEQDVGMKYEEFMGTSATETSYTRGWLCEATSRAYQRR